MCTKSNGFRPMLYRQAIAGFFLIFVCIMLILLQSSYGVFAEYSRFQEPVWHPSENLIALSNGRSVRLYDDNLSEILDEFELTTTQNPFIRTTALEWSPDGTMLGVTVQGSDFVPALQIWNIQTGQQIAQISDISVSAAFSWGVNSNQVAVVYVRGLGDVAIRIYNVPDVDIFTEFEIDDQLGNIDNIRWSPDGRYLAVSRGNTLYLLDVQSGRFSTSAVSLLGSSENPRFLFSPDSQYLIGVTDPDAIKVTILNVATGQIAYTLVGHADRILSVNWVDQYIGTVSLDGVTKIWSPTTFDEILSLQTGITSLPSFSPDGRAFVASASDFNTVVVRSSEIGAIIASLDPIEVTPTFTPTATNMFNCKDRIGVGSS